MVSQIVTPYHSDIQGTATLYTELVTICYRLPIPAPPSTVNNKDPYEMALNAVFKSHFLA